ncbi:hypothetical protein [Nocardioides sp. GCM10030258]|uniref:hypothetical protein n=1 Tax=unclassified Nocardioides TaxID=2615069 RepID=UPI00360FEA02
MDLEPTRSAYERLMLRVATETIGSDADVISGAPAKDFLARIEFTSRDQSDRAAVMNMHTEWLEAVFVLNPNLGVFMLDDFTDADYAAAQVRVMAEVVHAYLRGEGSMETRRSFLFRRRPQLRLDVNDREWLAR